MKRLRPTLTVLEEEAIASIFAGAVTVLEDTGVKFLNEKAIQALKDGGADVNDEHQIAKIPRELVKEAIKIAPKSIKIYDRNGDLWMTLEGNSVYFHPGGSAIKFLDSQTRAARDPTTKDLAEFAHLVDALENIHAQSVSINPMDIPHPLIDRWRVYVILNNSTKPLIDGVFSVESLHDLKDMILTFRGDLKTLAQKPFLIVDACPSPPLQWDRHVTQNIIDSATFGMPVEFISMPLAGATAPATLAGSLVLHTAETLSGIVLAQLVNPRAPVIYGGSPAIFDMKFGTTPMGAIETQLLDCGYVQIGKHFDLPTHSFMGLSDSKTIDAQLGFESASGTLLAALMGVNLVAGPGMLEFESCESPEKLVLDNEMCGLALRFIEGIDVTEETLAIDLFNKIGTGGSFLETKHTLEWFRKEQYLNLRVFNRQERGQWIQKGAKDSWNKAQEVVNSILSEYIPDPLPLDVQTDLDGIMQRIAERMGVNALPQARYW
ncbi:MAG: trimethylamine methyltransferase family protein [Candidatus Heimdallarchaeota archaeon]